MQSKIPVYPYNAKTAQERGVYDEQRSYDYIAQLLKITPTAANVKQYCTIVHDKSLLRALATASSEITEMVYDGVGTALS